MDDEVLQRDDVGAFEGLGRGEEKLEGFREIVQGSIRKARKPWKNGEV